MQSQNPFLILYHSPELLTWGILVVQNWPSDDLGFTVRTQTFKVPRHCQASLFVMYPLLCPECSVICRSFSTAEIAHGPSILL